MEVKLIIDSIDGDSSLEVPRAWTVDRLNISECSIPRDHDVDEWPHLNGIELPEIDSKEVRVLIGCNVPEAFWVLEERRGGRGEPVAIRSLLGWTLIGPNVKVKEESTFKVNFVRLNDESDSRDETLLLQVKNFWETDLQIRYLVLKSPCPLKMREHWQLWSLPSERSQDVIKWPSHGDSNLLTCQTTESSLSSDCPC